MPALKIKNILVLLIGLLLCCEFMISCGASKTLGDQKSPDNGNQVPPTPPPANVTVIVNNNALPDSKADLTATYTIQNTGSDITLNSITPLDSVNPNDFQTITSCLNNGTAILKQGTSCAVTVNFSTQDAARPDGGQHDYQFNLAYTGLTGGKVIITSPKVTGNDAPIPSPSGAIVVSTNRPTTAPPLSDTDNQVIYTITNNSSQTATLGTINPITDTGPDTVVHFTTDSSDCVNKSVLQPQGDHCAVSVKFSSNNEFDGKPHSIYLTINYNNNPQPIKSGIVTGNDAIMPSPTEFLTAKMNSPRQLTSADNKATFTITNTSSSQVATLNANAITPLNTTNFTANSSDCTTKKTLYPQGSAVGSSTCQVTVTFKPSTNPIGDIHKYQFAVSYNTTITTQSDLISGIDPLTPPTLTIIPDNKKLNSATPIATFTITNTSKNNQTALLNSMTINDPKPASPPHFTVTSDQCSNTSLAPNATCQLQVTFNSVYANSEDSAVFYAQVVVNFNNTSASSDPLEGDDKFITLAISAPSIPILNSQIKQSFYTITNASAAPATAILIQPDPSLASDFTTSNCLDSAGNTVTTLNPGDTCKVGVTILPALYNATNAQTVSYKFSILYNNPSYQTTSSALTGSTHSSTASPFTSGYSPGDSYDSGWHTVSCDGNALVNASTSFLPASENSTSIQSISTFAYQSYWEGTPKGTSPPPNNFLPYPIPAPYSFMYEDFDLGYLYCQVQVTFTDGYQATIKSQTINYGSD